MNNVTGTTKRNRWVSIAIALCLSCLGFANAIQASEPMRVIFETDMGNDVDDALALDLLYKYADEKKINLLAIGINKEGKYPAVYIDILNNWYGHKVPIGIIHSGADCENDAVNYAKVVSLMKRPNGKFAFKRSIKNYDALPTVPELYRKILSQQPDHSVVLISTGFSTNLSRLLATLGDQYSPLSGKELVAKKIKILHVMAGRFDKKNYSEYNVLKDIPSAIDLYAHWPTEIVTSPFELGKKITYPATSIENDFGWTSLHPVIEAYKAYKPMPYNRPTWDLTSVLYAVEGEKMFEVSPRGFITVTPKGQTVFKEDPQGKHVYLKVTPQMAADIKAYFVSKISAKPKHYKK